LLVPQKGDCVLFTYGVNYEQVKAEAAGFNVELLKKSGELTEKLTPIVKNFKIHKAALDSIGHEFYRTISKSFRGLARLTLRNDMLWKLRQVKDEHEIKLMKKAGSITSAGMKAAYETIRPGRTEIEVAAEIEYAMRKENGWGSAFETIVASGVRSTYPHGGCADRKIREDDLVVVDIGSAYQHYASDMTRTIIAGAPNEKQKRIHEIVKNAHENAFRAVKAGAKGKDIDNAARRTIEDSGFGQYFVHGLGHGVGLDIHEPPSFSTSSKDLLAVGNVMTIEPGIYVPNFGGVRLEDTILVRKDEAEKLTEGTYELQAET